MQKSLPRQTAWICLQALCLGLLMDSSTVISGRREPIVPVQLKAEDESAILKALGVQRTQVKSIEGYRMASSPRINASVVVHRKDLALYIEAVKETNCVKWRLGWKCQTEHSANAIHALLREGCAGGWIPAQKKPYVSFALEEPPPVARIYSTIKFLCTSEEMRQRVWLKGRGVHIAWIDRNEQGDIVVRTEGPSGQMGFDIELQPACGEPHCGFTIRRVIEWIT